MRIKNLNDSAFTLLEVLLASVIFLISVAGVFITLSAVRAPVIAKENQLASVVFGNQVLEALYSQVNYGGLTPYYSACVNPANGGTLLIPCTDFSLSVGNHQVSVATLTANHLTWPGSLTVNNLNGNPSVLKYNVICQNGSVLPDCGDKANPHQAVLNITF